MSSGGASGAGGRVTPDKRIAALFGLRGEHWVRHADPLSVWTRFAVLPLLAVAVQVAGLAVMVYGLVRLDLVATVAGLALTQCAKSWYIDRAALLFEDVKSRDPEYAAWEYGDRPAPAGGPLAVDDISEDEVRERPT